MAFTYLLDVIDSDRLFIVTCYGRLFGSTNDCRRRYRRRRRIISNRPTAGASVGAGADTTVSGRICGHRVIGDANEASAALAQIATTRRAGVPVGAAQLAIGRPGTKVCLTFIALFAALVFQLDFFAARQRLAQVHLAVDLPIVTPTYLTV